jgi:hypothetical protein
MLPFCATLGRFLFYTILSGLYILFTYLILAFSIDLFAPANLVLRSSCALGQVLSAYLLATSMRVGLLNLNLHLADLFLTPTPIASYIGFLAAAASLIIDAIFQLFLSPTPPPTEPIILLSIGSFLIIRYATKFALNLN